MTLQQTDLNVAPFFDDYDPSKNFHRVLFRPGKTVQARELTQAQTIMQEQINRLGRHLFQEGSVVIPGGINAIADKDTVSAAIGGQIDVAVLAANVGRVYIVSTTSGVEAKMVKYVPATQADPAAFAIDYVKTANDGTTRTFTVNEACKLVIRQESGDVMLVNMIINGTHKGTYVSVLPGVYFVRGHLVQCNTQDILATPFRNDQKVHVGFNIIENVVSETQDASLLSNAQGYPNFKAPGASRLQFSLTLASYVDDYNDNAFVEIVTFGDGKLLNKVVNTDYNLLMDSIAQRSFETNGNFTVAPIPLAVYNHVRNDDFRDGLLPPEQGGDPTKLIYRLGRGVAYTSGFRSEIQTYFDIVADKAIDTKGLRNVVLSTTYGSYVLVNSEVSVPFIDLKKRISLFDISNANIGSFIVRSIKRHSSTQLRLYIMDLRMVDTHQFGEAKKAVYQDAANNISLTLGGSNIYDSSNDSLLFRMPFDAVKSVSSGNGVTTSYSVVRTYDLTLNSSGVGTVSLPANEFFLSLNDFDYVAALTGFNTVGTQFPTSAITLGGSGGNKTLTVNVGASYSGNVVRVVAPVYKSVANQKTKTLDTRTQTVTFTDQNAKILDRCDVVKLREILFNDTVNNVTVEVTSQFGYRTGSRPNWYENGSVYTLDGVKRTGSYQITYDYFIHSGGDYFSVDSYGGMLREDIPDSSDTADRKSTSLADCLDFRPLRDAATATDSTLGNFSPVSWLGDMIDPNDNIRFDVTYYTNRIDLVYAAPDGSFAAARGNPDDSPQCPVAPNSGMPLYQVYIPAYTFDITQVRLSTYDNRRYTMRDIGKLENRISNLEYYTSLNMLESKVERTQVIDPTTGLNRFKNGFSADNFQSTNMCDVYDPMWQASIDFSNGLLLASYKESPSDMIASTGTNYKQGITVMKDYTTTPSISQTLATETININPYAVFTWSGTVALLPSADFWKETVYLPPILRKANGQVTSGGNSNGPTQQQINDYNNSIFHLTPTPETLSLITSGSPLVTTAGSLLTWETQSGGVVAIPNTLIQGVAMEIPVWALTSYTAADVPGFVPGSVLSGFPKPPAGVPIWSPETANNTGALTWGITGTRTSTSIVRSNYDNLISTSVIPWMRSIKINVDLKGFRPFTKLYAFFNGINVDAYIQQVAPVANTLGKNVVVDDAGSAKATFTIPSDATMRFPVGEATLRFTDDPVNGATNAQSFTNGETLFTSGGTLSTRQVTTVETKVTTIETEWGWVSPPVDPIAQTFYVADAGGIWVPKIDLFFAKKAKSVPVRIQIRSVIAGLPTNIVAHNSNVSLLPSQVNVSANGTVPTSFVFNDPIFLEGATEYAIVVLADTQEYEVFVATMGQRVLGRNMNVAEQPNIGVFLTSSNSSTWTPDQLRDLAFVIHKCQFSTSTASQVVFNGFQPAPQLTTSNPLYVRSGSNTVQLNIRSHGLKIGDSVNILSITEGAGIPLAELMGVHTVTDASIDWLKFTTTTPANVDAAIGGTVLVQANYPVSEFRPNARQLLLPGTNIVWEYQYVAQSNRAVSAWLPFTNTDYTQGMPSEGVVRQSGDFKIRATMTTTDVNLTPQIHTHGLGVQLISRRLTNDTTNPAYNYVTKSVKFDTPSTSMKMYLGVNLPGSTTMKVFYKLLTSGSDNTNLLTWVESNPTKPIVNQAKGFTEYEFEVNSTTPFVGYKLMVQFFGPDPVDCPIVSDFRSVALA